VADPIVCDCGGSTRIKQILPSGVGDLPDLLNVHDFDPKTETDSDKQKILEDLQKQFPAKTIAGSQQKIESADAPFKKLTIMFQDANGTPFTITIPVKLPGSFVIASSLDQNVRMDLLSLTDGGAGGLVITIFSTVTDPLVEVKQLRLDVALRQGVPHKRKRPSGAIRHSQRRYIVTNAGPIETITLNNSPNPIFDASNPDAARVVGPVGGPARPDPGLPLYVSVVVS
jgi:hypothetical protein